MKNIKKWILIIMNLVLMVVFSGTTFATDTNRIPTSPTITVKSREGTEISSKWTNKDLYIYVDGSTINSEESSVGYKYKINSTGTYVEYTQPVVYTTAYSVLTPSTAFYAKAFNIESESNESSEVFTVLPKIDKVSPTLTMTVDKNEWANSHTATIKFDDEGGSGFRVDSYNLSYVWTTSEITPTSWGTLTKTVNLTTGAKTHTETITKNDGTGLFYLHIKLDKNITDIATNACETTTLCVPFYMDNTAPVIRRKNVDSNPIALTSKSIYTMDFQIVDEHSGITPSKFSETGIIVKVNGAASTASKKLTYISESNGIYEYSLELANITETGEITLQILGNAVSDNVFNSSSPITFNLTQKSGLDFRGPYADNIAPYIHMMGPITAIKVDAGKNLSGFIDERYINQYYTIEIPFKVLDVGGQDVVNNFEPADISVAVGGIVLSPSRKDLTLDTSSKTKDEQTNLTIYETDYTLILYGLFEDGYINLTAMAGAITDYAGNINTQTKFAPYTAQTGANEVIYVDNTLPQPTIRGAYIEKIENGIITINVEMFLKELGAGITEEQFKKDDMKIRINGSLATDVTAVLESDLNNNYESALGSTIATNYTYKLLLSNIKESGILKIQIVENKIIDKANNGNQSITLDLNVELDNEPPKLGVLITNANANGEVYGEPIKVSILGCTDSTGIVKYEWQRSVDGINFETIFLDENNGADSSIDDFPKTARKYYYKVIVTDSLGASSESEVVWVDYRHELNAKPIITLTKQQTDSELVEIHGVIKSKKDIEKIVVNENEYSKQNWQDSVVTNNYEIITTFDYPVTRNGIYTIEVTDKTGNVATATMNIASLDFTEAIINYVKKDVTQLASAQIIFTSNEPVRIINPNAHSGITYDTTNFSTRIIAMISGDVDFNETKIFEFENKGLREIAVEVEPPLMTKFGYIRFATPESSNLNMTTVQIESLVDSLTDTKLITFAGQIKPYYGLKNTNVQIATETDINTAEKLGNASETYVLDDNGELTKLEKNVDETPTSSSNYSTGNISGTYKKTSGLLDNYSDIYLNDTTIKYEKFRIVLIP